MSDVIPAWVSGWIGLPWADRGRGPQAYDCWGLVRAVLAEQFALEVPDFSQKYGRSRSASAASVIDAERLDWQRVATNQRD
jgi:cell wall-associated NlpC family hydrolase